MNIPIVRNRRLRNPVDAVTCTNMATTKMPTMIWGHEPVADAFRAFKARTESYLEDQNVNDRHKQDQNVNDRHKQDQNVNDRHKYKKNPGIRFL